MKVWLLTLKRWESSWHTRRFKETAAEMGIECSTVTPDDFDIIVAKKGKSCIYYKGKPVKIGSENCSVW